MATVAVEKVFGQFRPVQMSGFQQHGPGSHIAKRGGGGGKIGLGTDRHPRNVFGFRNIRRHQRRQRKNMPTDRLRSGFADQTVARGSHHHRIHHHAAHPVFFQRFRDRNDHFVSRQHAEFYGVGADILQHRRDLSGDHFRRNDMKTPYAYGILNGYGRDRRHRIAAAGRYGLDIGLNTGPPSAVGAGYRKYFFVFFHSANL